MSSIPAPPRRLVAPPLVQKAPKPKRAPPSNTTAQATTTLSTVVAVAAPTPVPDASSHQSSDTAAVRELPTPSSNITKGAKRSKQQAPARASANHHVDPAADTPPTSEQPAPATTAAPPRTPPPAVQQQQQQQPFQWHGPLHVPVDVPKLRDAAAPVVPVRPVLAFLRSPTYAHKAPSLPAAAPSAPLPSVVRGISAAAGNACYIAAVLQVVLHCPPLTHVLVSAAIREPALRIAAGKASAVAPLSVAATVGQWILQCWAQRGAAAVGLPVCFTKQSGVKHVMLSSAGGAIADGTLQEDAMEFFTAFVRLIDKELTACGVVGGCSATATASAAAGPSPSAASAKGWVTVGRGKEKLTVRQEGGAGGIGDAAADANGSGGGGGGVLASSVFDGTLRVGTKGTARGGITSVVLEPFVSLCLPVSVPNAKGPVPSLLECIQCALAKESLSSAAEGDARHITRATAFGRLPGVLVLQLMRWAVTREGDVLKLDNRVSIPAKLHLPASMIGTPQSTGPAGAKANGGGAAAGEYRLQSVVCHHGNAPRSGHYVTYLVSWDDATAGGGGGAGGASAGPRVTLANDARVAEVGVGAAALAAVEIDTPYLLFYGRCSNSAA